MNVLDLFSGIGGFTLGLEQAGIKTKWVGFSDIDKYANELYKRRFPNAKELGSIKNVSYESLEGQRLDLLTGGFPCQAFSIAGKRRGFKDTRGTLFFEIERILRDYIKNGKPIPCILLENVKGLLSHDNKRTFTTIYKVLTDLNYTLELQVVNTKWWLPQNRERIFIFGRYNGNPSGRKVFPIGFSGQKNNELQEQYTNTLTSRYFGATGGGSYIVESKLNEKKGKLNQIGTLGKDNQANRVYSTDGISKTLTDGGGGGAKTGLYKVNQIGTRLDSGGVQPYQQDRVYDTNGISPALSHGKSDLIVKTQAIEYKILDDYNNKIKENGICGTITQHCSRIARGNGMKVIENDSRIRKLTPTECERLQGFPDGWTEGQSDSQRYKQLGNAVSVPVIKAIMEKIYDL